MPCFNTVVKIQRGDHFRVAIAILTKVFSIFLIISFQEIHHQLFTILLFHKILSIYIYFCSSRYHFRIFHHFHHYNLVQHFFHSIQKLPQMLSLQYTLRKTCKQFLKVIHYVDIYKNTLTCIETHSKIDETNQEHYIFLTTIPCKLSTSLHHYIVNISALCPMLSCILTHI